MSCCKHFTEVLACFTAADGTKQTVTKVTEFGKDSADGKIKPLAVRFMGEGETSIDTSNGTVTLGACPVAPPDIEFEKMCDVQTDGTVIEYYHKIVTTFDENNQATSVVTDVEIDKNTVYTPTGTVGTCNQDCDAEAKQGVVNDWV